jgi:hypothetical protein
MHEPMYQIEFLPGGFHLLLERRQSARNLGDFLFDGPCPRRQRSGVKLGGIYVFHFHAVIIL